MACGRIKRHIKGVENKTTGGDCLSEFEYNEDAISELLIKISETMEFKRIEHDVNNWVHYYAYAFIIPVAQGLF